VALFDLDGTITRTDTMLEFLAFAIGWWRSRLLLAMVLPVWLLAQLRLLRPDVPKRTLMRLAFGGVEVAKLERCARDFAAEVMPSLLRPGAEICIKHHLSDGHEVMIVTASCSLWVLPWCKQQKTSLIATELEICDGTFTGRLSTPNCKGAEKVRRIRAILGDTELLDVHVYADTPSDRPMLELAQVPHYRPFR
jgi:HAD superfamily hydrolase (TIGR01490 family)